MAMQKVRLDHPYDVTIGQCVISSVALRGGSRCFQNKCVDFDFGFNLILFVMSMFKLSSLVT